MATNYFLKLDKYEGPLDLLLHLIRQSELDIFDIDLFVLTQQYLDFLRLVSFRNLREASLFIDMAASLIEIKSRQLIPNDEKHPNSEKNDDSEELTADQLQQRLLNYDQFQKAGAFLADSASDLEITAYNHEWMRLEPLYEHIESPLTGDPMTLIMLYEQLLGELSERRPTVSAVTESVTVEKMMAKLDQMLEELEFLMFQQTYQKTQSRYELVANILAFLQMTRDRKLRFFQDEANGPIWIYKNNLEENEIKKQDRYQKELQTFTNSPKTTNHETPYAKH